MDGVRLVQSGRPPGPGRVAAALAVVRAGAGRTAHAFTPTALVGVYLSRQRPALGQDVTYLRFAWPARWATPRRARARRRHPPHAVAHARGNARRSRPACAAAGAALPGRPPGRPALSARPGEHRPQRLPQRTEASPPAARSRAPAAPSSACGRRRHDLQTRPRHPAAIRTPPAASAGRLRHWHQQRAAQRGVGRRSSRAITARFTGRDQLLLRGAPHHRHVLGQPGRRAAPPGWKAKATLAISARPGRPQWRIASVRRRIRSGVSARAVVAQQRDRGPPGPSCWRATSSATMPPSGAHQHQGHGGLGQRPAAMVGRCRSAGARQIPALRAAGPARPPGVSKGRRRRPGRAAGSRLYHRGRVCP